MTRISLVDLDLESPDSSETTDRSREHCIILMENLSETSNAPRVRERSLESEARESPSKRPYSEENLVFETHVVDVEGDDGHGRGEGDQADGDAVVEGWNVRKACRMVCGI